VVIPGLVDIEMHRIALHLGSLTIYWYGVMVAAGFLAGLWNANRRALRNNLSPELITDLGTWLGVGAIVGSRLLYVITYWNEYFAHEPIWEIFMLRNGGLVFFGGLAGATLTGTLYVFYKKLPFWKVADVMSPSIALGHVFGRIGCFLNGCCYGYPTQCPWAVHYPADHEGTGGAGVHPTQIYEALLNLGLFTFLAWFHPRKKYDGQIFALYLVGYACLRAFVEIFRGDYKTYYWGGHVTPAQLVSAGIFSLGMILLWRLPIKNKQAATTKP
jgi:phosphatidylglycerol---prolipoprotein diacylglyceryl transferase